MPLLIAILRIDDRSASPGPLRSWRLGFTCGVVYFAGTVYWVAPVIQTYGGLGLTVTWLVASALVAYLALFPAVFALVIAQLGRSSRGKALFFAPAAWVTTELARAHLLTGFPWVLLGYSQTAVLPVAQFASVFGVLRRVGPCGLRNAALGYLALAPCESFLR